GGRRRARHDRREQTDENENAELTSHRTLPVQQIGGHGSLRYQGFPWLGSGKIPRLGKRGKPREVPREGSSPGGRAQALVEQELAVPLREVVDVAGGAEAERRVHLDRDRVGLLGRRE